MDWPKEIKHCPECGLHPYPDCHKTTCCYWEYRKNIFTTLYDPTYGDDKECVCGHSYYHHFDWAENYSPGCKYCPSCIFKSSSAKMYHYTIYNWGRDLEDSRVGCVSAPDHKEAVAEYIKDFNLNPKNDDEKWQISHSVIFESMYEAKCKFCGKIYYDEAE